MLRDRFCIHSEGQVNVTLAPQDLVACNFENFGCGGGFLVNTIDFLQTEGVTSEECMPYQDRDSPCGFKCANASVADYLGSKHYCRPGSLKIHTRQEDIQRELMANGPLMVGLTVYEDFNSYKAGVYHHVAGNMVGGHAIIMVGWGHSDEEGGDGSLYWICQNQWGTNWGEDGFIRIRAGEIGLDSMAIGCMPDLVETKVYS
jgi:cathepsin B